MSNSSYTIWIEILRLRNQPNQIASKWIVNCLCRKFIEFYMNSSSFHKPTLKINLLLFFIYNLVYGANFVTKKNLIFWKESTKRTLFYNKNAGYKQHFQKLKLVIITARKWYRNSTHLEMNYKSFNLFTILHPTKQKYTNRSKQTNKRFKFYFQILNSQTVEIHWAFRNWERKEIWGSKLVPDGWNSRRDLKDK